MSASIAHHLALRGCTDLLVLEQGSQPALALAAGRSEFRIQRITSHLLADAHVIRQFTPAQYDMKIS